MRWRNKARVAPSAFLPFYEEHAHGVLVFFVRRTFDVEVARDLTAETFAQAFESRARFRGTSDDQAAAWLYAIARHLLARYVRKGVAERKVVQRLGIQVPDVSADDHDRIVELASLRDLRERVRTAFMSLTPEQRDALQLRVIDECPYPEVAKRLRVSEQAARARVSRALRELVTAIELTENPEVSS